MERARASRRHQPNAKDQRLDPGLRRGDGGVLYPSFSASPQERWSPAGARPAPITASRNPACTANQSKPNKDQTPSTGPRPAPGRRIVRMPCPKRRRYTPPAMAKPSRQWPSLLQRRAQPAAGGTGPALRQGVFYPSFLRRGGESLKTERQRPPGPRPARGDDRGRRRAHDTPPAMAKPSRQWPSLLQAPSAARGRRELSRRCLSPPGRVSTRPAGRGWSEGTGASRRCGRGVFIHLSCRHKKGGRPPGRDPANHRQPKGPKTERQRPKCLDPACAGRRIVTDRHAHD